MSDFQKARQLMKEFQGEKYLFGSGVIGQVGSVAAELGKKAAFVYDVFPSNEAPRKAVQESLKAAGVELVKEIEGAKPNAPREDITRITEGLMSTDADVIVCLGGGSTIDATKARGGPPDPGRRRGRLLRRRARSPRS